MPPDLTVSQWSDEYRMLSRESSASGGKWISLPMQREPMDAVNDRDVRSVCLMWAAQTAGKTEIINNIVGYHIDQNPSPILMLQPTLEMGENWSKTRLIPMVRDTPALRGKIADQKSRSSNNTILHKNFPGGHLSIVGANSPAGLASRPIRAVLCDEVDRYPETAGTEGDPIDLAVARTTTFPDRVLFMTSTPTVRGFSRIEKEFESSDKRFWFVPCARCGHWHDLKWANVKWPPGKPEEAWLECPQCLAQLTDSERQEMLYKGEWRPTAPFNGIRGYHLNGIYVMFPAAKGFKNRLHQMAVQFLEAKSKGEQSIRTWQNTFLAETYEIAAEQVDAVKVLEQCEQYPDDVPDGVAVLVSGVDVQDTRLEVEVVGFGKGEESWGIDKIILHGKTDKADVWQLLYEALEKRYRHVSGVTLKVAAACIDSGFRPREVYNFVLSHPMRRFYAVKGSSTPGAPAVSLAQKRSVRRCPVYMIGTDTIKETIYSRLKISAPGAGFSHFPVGRGYDAEHFHQLTAEKIITQKVRGFAKRVWIKTRDRNEALDIRCYAHAALELLNPDYDECLRRLRVDPHPPQEKHKPELPGARKSASRQNWVNAWKKF